MTDAIVTALVIADLIWELHFYVYICDGLDCPSPSPTPVHVGVLVPQYLMM
jgi:hypothetical protein